MQTSYIPSTLRQNGAQLPGATTRFYRMGTMLRWTFTVFWVVLLGGYLEEMVRRRTFGHFHTWIWIVLGVGQLWTIWGSYWTVGEDRLSYHAWPARRRDFDLTRLRYAGPPRRAWLRKWNKDVMEIDVTGSLLPTAATYITTSQRKSLLERLRITAPQAEVVD